MEQGPDGVARHRYEFDYCPVNYVDPDQKDLLGLFGLWKQQKMLYPGGVGDQPAKYIDIMILLDGWWAQAERDAIEKVGKNRGSGLPKMTRKRG